jgi:hypothetical protein
MSKPSEDKDTESQIVSSLPEVKVHETANDEMFYCPQPWMLALTCVAMTALSSITVAGSLLFVLASPQKVTPHCYEHPHVWIRGFCVTSTLAFWTYPVVCCLFVVIVYAKNMVDQRTYYELLLHKVVVGYGKDPVYTQPLIIALAVYALVALSALVWLHCRHGEVSLQHFYSSMAYISPIISFLAVLFSKWFVQDNLITLPNFVEEYSWAVEHLSSSRVYLQSELHAGFELLEDELSKSNDAVFDTPHMVALVEHYAREVKEKVQKDEEVEKDVEENKVDQGTDANKTSVKRYSVVLEELFEAGLRPSQKNLYQRTVYWEVRFLFSSRLQDDRSRDFQRWGIAIVVATFLVIVLSLWLYACCVVTCLEIEKILPPSSMTRRFSLRPDLHEENAHTFAAAVANQVAMSALQTGARLSPLRNGLPGLSVFFSSIIEWGRHVL